MNGAELNRERFMSVIPHVFINSLRYMDHSAQIYSLDKRGLHANLMNVCTCPIYLTCSMENNFRFDHRTRNLYKYEN